MVVLMALIKSLCSYSLLRNELDLKILLEIQESKPEYSPEIHIHLYTFSFEVKIQAIVLY